jgi:hypothetical protein
MTSMATSRDDGIARSPAATSIAKPPPPLDVRRTILAQDPAVLEAGTTRILRADVPVPYDEVLRGPRSSRFAVVDYDATRNRLHPPTELCDAETLKGLTDRQLIDSRAFRAQNVYAIAARTLGAFEVALGRRIPWSFTGHQLNLVPAAFNEANAYYDAESNAVLFGYFEGQVRQRDGKWKRGTVYTGLSHDIVAHETTHAVLDGLRSRFEEPGLPDQLAFHEAFADIVALLSVFSVEELVETALGEADAEGRIPSSRVDEEALRCGVLLGLAEEMGEATTAHSGAALRRSVAMAKITTWVDDPDFDEPHRRGEILVAAVMRAFVGMWVDRLDALTSREGRLDRKRAAEEGRKSAEHLLRMVIRAIDYTPPLEFEYDDFVEALLVSDAEAAPDDAHHYRERLRTSFADFGMAPQGRVVEIGRVARLTYDSINAAELRQRSDEVFRFLWLNAVPAGLDRAYYATVDDLVPSIRVGPDGLVLQEVVGTYRQMLNGTAAELKALSKGALDVGGLEDGTPIQLHGGGTLIFDQFGRAKHHVQKPIFDWGRQSRRLAYLVRNGMTDRSGRFGFSPGIAEGQRFAVLHDPSIDPEEVW